MGDAAKKVPTRELPNWVVRLPYSTKGPVSNAGGALSAAWVSGDYNGVSWTL